MSDASFMMVRVKVGTQPLNGPMGGVRHFRIFKLLPGSYESERRQLKASVVRELGYAA